MKHENPASSFFHLTQLIKEELLNNMYNNNCNVPGLFLIKLDRLPISLLICRSADSSPFTGLSMSERHIVANIMEMAAKSKMEFIADCQIINHNLFRSAFTQNSPHSSAKNATFLPLRLNSCLRWRLCTGLSNHHNVLLEPF